MQKTKKTNPESDILFAPPVAQGQQDGITLNNKVLLTITLLLAGLYYLYSQKATGFYQQDEAAHFVSMRGFWYNPSSILSNWAKPGYKLIYALPSLLGVEFVSFVNCLFAAFTCFFAYKATEILNKRVALLAFVAAASQPLWVNLAFRNYSELLAAFLLILAVYLHLKHKYIFAALVASYIAFVRQEFYPFLGLYFLVLGWNKQYVPALLLGTFPLVHHVWGAIVRDDIFYLYNEIVKSNKEIGDAWPRQGFNHYLKMSITIFGGAVVTLVVAYTAAKIFKKEAPAYIVFLPVVLFVLMHSLFNWQAFKIGASGGGNLRYMLVISPLASVLAALAIDEVRTLKDKWRVLAVLAVFALLVAAFMTYKHNYILFTQEKDWIPMFGVILATVVLFIPLTSQQQVTYMSAVMLFTALLTVRPLEISEEDKTCQLMAQWYRNYEKEKGSRKVFVDHAMFYYYLGRTSFEFVPPARNLTKTELEQSPAGTLIIWDSHYSYRPEWKKDCLDYNYFIKKPEQYTLLQEMMSSDQRFGFLIFEKTK